MLRESSKFTGYNFRNYAIRRIRDSFKENKSITNPEQISGLINKAEENLAVIRRQTVISQLYAEPKLIIESRSDAKIKS
uniref:LYR motif-containing protein 4-like n=1 Tax=Saccoglossus kowalevskii TaxID=10224 RepID=A0ABM0MAH0_SACKO|nr:PREDICTED: LYR motif-containing protein 4-like [Saccoglossus kowalevskii]